MKVFIADDHQLFIEGIHSVLAEVYADIEVDFANNGHSALNALTAEVFDIALIDLRLPNLDGFNLLHELFNINCLTPVIMVTASEDPLDMQKALDLGAMGFVPKSSTGKQIINAINRVLMGEVIRPDNLKQADMPITTKEDWARQHNITPRQLEVLRLIRNGLSNQAIADKLYLSKATVKTHIIAIFRALDTQSRTESVQKAQQLGLD